MQSKSLTKLLGLGSILLCSHAAFATVIAPNPGGPVLPSAFASTFSIVGGTFSSAAVTAGAGLFSGTLDVAVATEVGGNGYCAGCLDFLYQFAPTAPPGDIMQTMSMTSFAPALGSIDVGYVTTNAGNGLGAFLAPTTGAVCGIGGASPCTPATGTWNATSTVTVDWGADSVPVGKISDIIVIRTPATAFAAGTVHLIDDSTINGAAWQPAIVPEPNSVGLLGGLLAAGLFVARRYRVSQK